MLDIRVMGVYGVEKFMQTERSKTDNYAVISVFDDERPFVHADKPHLHVYVNDIDETNAEEILAVKPNWKLFDIYDAEVIKRWVEVVKDRVDYFIIHCHAGVSRSRGVAAALCLVHNGNDKVHFEQGVPNSTIYKVMLEAYGLTNKYPLEFSDEIITEAVCLGDLIEEEK